MITRILRQLEIAKNRNLIRAYDHYRVPKAPRAMIVLYFTDETPESIIERMIDHLTLSYRATVYRLDTYVIHAHVDETKQ